MMDAMEKFTAFFFTLIVVGMGYMGYQHMVDRSDCTKVALSQNYSAEQIKSICR